MKLTAHQVADIAAMAAASVQACPGGYNIHHTAFLLCQVHICGRKLRKFNELGRMLVNDERTEHARLVDKARRILMKLGANVVHFSTNPLSKPIQLSFEDLPLGSFDTHTFRYQLG